MPANLDKAKQMVKTNSLPVKFDERGSVKEIICKGCGVKISGLMISDAEPQHVNLGKRMVTVSTMEFVRLSNYAEGTILFDDKSAHVTSVCRKCLEEVKKLNDPEVLLDWYTQDIAVWLKEIELTGIGEIHPLSLKRTPVRLV